MSLRAIDIECRKITTHKCTVQLGGNKSKGSVSCIDTRQQELVFSNPTSTVTPFILADFGRDRVAACV